ncbi:MAG TPA: nucleoside triphosphate pyrophosphatase [Pirellulales bacterium]|jgi:septum formation protein|nr:nucleoside triphosphate pyrophosphatase [Pirellulales bacterium]
MHSESQHREAKLKLILASGSPQRRRLMTEAGYRFEVVVPAEHAEDGPNAGEVPVDYAARMAYQKAADVVGRVPAGVVIACDTIVECGGEILGKPTDVADARRMLLALSGQVHHVYSGLCVWPRPDGEPAIRTAETRLVMNRLSTEVLEEYLASGAWAGKSGAFGYQDRHGWLQVVEGSESNVIGLPLELLGEMLAQAGLPPPN